MNNFPFKVGDEVICINDANGTKKYIKKNKIYRIAKVFIETLIIEDDRCINEEIQYYKSRFILATPTARILYGESDESEK